MFDPQALAQAIYNRHLAEQRANPLPSDEKLESVEDLAVKLSRVNDAIKRRHMCEERWNPFHSEE